MPNVPDLSQVQNGQAQQPAANGKDAPYPCRTAFTVFVQFDGTVQASPDLDAKFAPQMAPGADDVYGACAVLQKDMAAQQNAQEIVNAQMAMAQRMKDIAESQNLVDGLGNLRGGGR
jgi:hypothetical protein